MASAMTPFNMTSFPAAADAAAVPGSSDCLADPNGTDWNATCSDNATTMTSPEDMYSDWQKVLIAIACTVLVVGTVIGNVLVCTAVVIVRRLRTPSNLLIVSLAVSDLLVAVLDMPFAAAYEVMGVWVLGQSVCDAWTSLDVLLCTASILNLCVISIDRYFVITRPFQYAMKRTPIRMALMIIAVWVMSAVISIPPLFGWRAVKKPGECMVSQNIGYQFYATIGAFYLPLTVMIVIYVRIYLVSSRIARAEAMSKPSFDASQRFSLTPTTGSETPLRKDSVAVPPPPSASTTTTRSGNNDLLPPYPDASAPPRPFDHLLGTPLHDDAPPPPHSNGRQGNGHAMHCYQPAAAPICRRSRAFSFGELLPAAARRRSTMPFVGSGSENNRFRFFQKSRFNRISSSHERKATKTLGVIMGAFTACWLPFFILALIKPFCDDQNECIPRWLNGLFLWLGFANSLLNPVIYARFNRDFRTPFRHILQCHVRDINTRLRSDNYTEQYGGSTAGPRNSVAVGPEWLQHPRDSMTSTGEALVRLQSPPPRLTISEAL